MFSTQSQFLESSDLSLASFEISSLVFDWIIWSHMLGENKWRQNNQIKYKSKYKIIKQNITHYTLILIFTKLFPLNHTDEADAEMILSFRFLCAPTCIATAINDKMRLHILYIIHLDVVFLLHRLAGWDLNTTSD